MIKLITSLILFISFNAFALPIDWHGTFGVDSTIIEKPRFVEASSVTSTKAITESMEANTPAGSSSSASYQTYVFTLEPHIIINDAATLKIEMTSGYGKGGLLGDDTVTDASESENGNILFNQSQAGGDRTISISQAYLELYSDLATYQIGRHTKHWGLGARYSEGSGQWDRHSFAYDGISMKLKLNNFYITPFWARINTSDSGLSRLNHTNEYGVSLLYDNEDREFALGAIISKRSNGSQSDAYISGIHSGTLGNNEPKVLDIYFKSIFGNLTLEIEAPFMSGNMGTVYSPTQSSEYKASAILLETTYEMSKSFKLGFNAGMVSGDDAKKESEFSAMYLNPNYKVANLLFNYNHEAIANPGTNNIFDSYVNNVKYAKIWASYETGKWIWNSSFIYATASETAKAGSKYFNHSKNSVVDSAEYDQADDLGMEVDLGFDYYWNNEISITGNFGYLMTGDYYSFTNDSANKNTAANAYMLQLGVGVTF